MSSNITRRAFLQGAAVSAAAPLACRTRSRSTDVFKYNAHLMDLAGANAAGLREVRQSGANAAVFLIDENSDARQIQSAKSEARALGLEPAFWFEVGRNEEAARAHPEWLHTPQHNEWLASFPEWEHETASIFPWLPLNNEAVFDFQLERVGRAASMLEPGDSIFLNDVQNSPAGCGCGNLQCRSWDNSPGDKVAPSPYDHQDAYFTAIFLDAARRANPSLKLIPVVCPECERGVTVGEVFSPEDQTGYCKSVDCSDPCALYYYPGLLRALAGLERVGLLCAYKALGRDLPLYGGQAAWVGANISRYAEHAPRENLVAVLQGWDVSEEEVRAQKDAAASAGASSLILSRLPLDQSYWPVPANNL
jgi:hypothetical protein